VVKGGRKKKKEKRKNECGFSGGGVLGSATAVGDVY
jgi:hypothetical protein